MKNNKEITEKNLPNVKKMTDSQLRLCSMIKIEHRMSSELKLFLSKVNDEIFNRALLRAKKQNKNK